VLSQSVAAIRLVAVFTPPNYILQPVSPATNSSPRAETSSSKYRFWNGARAKLNEALHHGDISVKTYHKSGQRPKDILSRQLLGPNPQSSNASDLDIIAIYL
jgi:hypothetical protein